MNIEVIITDSEIDSLFKNSSFSTAFTPRQRIENAILERACGFSTGYTLECIMVNLGLLTKVSHNLTQRGRYYLWTVYKRK